MKVLFVIGQFYPIIGGAEIQAHRLAKALINKGINVEVLTSRPSGTKKHEIIDNIKIHRISGIGFGRLKIYTLCLNFILKILFCYKNFDIIHMHQGNQYSFAGVLASRILNKPGVVKCGNSGKAFDLKVLKSNFPGFPGKYMVKILTKHTAKFICISKQIINELMDYNVPGSKCIHIPNGIHISSNVLQVEKKRFKSDFGIKDDTFVLLCVAGLRKNKNHSALIKLMQELKIRNFKSKLIILGSGPEKENIQNEIKSADLTQLIEMTGWKDNVKDYLEAADLFVLPSFAEGLSNAILEAMLHKLPVMVSNIDANKEIIEDGNTGFLKDFSNIDSCVNFIINLSKNKELLKTVSENAYKKICEKYSIDVIAEQYVKVYSSLL